ncbi:MAG: TolC family outer membrane protein [Geminicoccaceae bacterium]
MTLAAGRRASRGGALAGAALAAWLGIAGTAWSDTLDEALVAAYLTNPDLDAARAQLRATDENVPQALAGFRPTVVGQAGVQILRGNNKQEGADQDSSISVDSTTTALQLTQNIYAGGGTTAQTSRAENLVKAGRAQLVASEQSVLFNAVQAYTSTWRDRAVLQLALSNEKVLRRQLQQTQDQFAVGEVAKTDVAQAEARLAGALADVEQAKANLAASDASYKQVIGKAPGKLVDPKQVGGLPKDLSEAQTIAEANPQIVQATYNLFAARDNVDVAFANLLPSVDLQGEVGYEDEPRRGVEWQEAASIGVTLTVPLYQGGSEYSLVRQNRETAQQRRSELESANRSVQATVSTAWEQLLAAQAAVTSLEAEVRANQIAFEGVYQEQQVGLRTVIDVLDAQQDLFQSQVNLVRAQAAEVTQSYQLRAATGNLTVVDLGLAVEPYNPEAYYDRNRTRLFGIDGSAG